MFALLGDLRGAITVAVMVSLSVALRWWQQARSERAVRGLKDSVTTTATVRRRATADARPMDREVPFDDVVPGDVVKLMPGDLVPADVRLLSATNLLVDQSALSGETLPVHKDAPDDTSSVCFAGTSVVGGTGTGLVIATGPRTRFGAMARTPRSTARESSFDRGVRAVGWTLLRFMFVLAPFVLVVNGIVTANWAQALLFAVAVAVGLTPEMLPVIVTSNLARGAVLLAHRQVIVKRLGAIQDLGAMDVLCVDKTGTLTEDRIAYVQGFDTAGQADEEVVDYAGLACHFQDVADNRLDEAIAARSGAVPDALYRKVDEVPFDHVRRRSTIVVQRSRDEHLLITKGAPDEVLARCTAEPNGNLTDERRHALTELATGFEKRSVRLLAIATGHVPARLEHYTARDERDLTLRGFLGFVDPIAPGAAAAVATLREHGVAVKMLTGDNPYAAAQVCEQVGLDPGEVVLGDRVEATTDAELPALVTGASVFARLTPPQKARVVAALREASHTVGFIGDGVNDTAALRTADVGISVTTATDAAKDAADVILAQRDLSVLAAGVTEGRRTLGNTLKYVHATASSNFGNVLSLLVASVFLPFLPMLPIQLVVQNLLYDTAQLALPWDRVDESYLRAPRRWDAAGLARFMLVFGPVSSLFDVATFGVLAWVLGTTTPAFQAGWFLESLASQVLVVLVLRTRATNLRAHRPSGPVLAAASIVLLTGLLIPLSPLAGALHMGALPTAYFGWLPLILLSYVLTVQAVKIVYVRRSRGWM
ncbi:magnesium-translocating P-type ATPase [Fodinicola feengrottensis]|uniref:magnesium-translocating P-type ATPase n=1 Tax=Fodinicola feengrottensis TaxID=435914 RepID=UPI002441101E|nr:magnesium-translocating P-type ATPase [Fodinicola feengrottensis]